MAISAKLIYVFLIFYALVILYILLYFFVPFFQELVITIRHNLAFLTTGPNYYWVLLISFGICFIGSASIGYPIPFPFVLFSFSNSVYLKYLNNGFSLTQIVGSFPFWLEILGIAVVGGLGNALGEFTGYLVGFGAKKVAEGKSHAITTNIQGFGRLVLENRRLTPLYVFLFALTPLPDDILFLSLGMIRYPFWKSIIPGWLGKTITVIFYCAWPIFIALGLAASGIVIDDTSSVITEAVLLLVTISIMFFIMGFNWNKFLENRRNSIKYRKEKPSD